MGRCSQFGSQVCLQFSLTLSLYYQSLFQVCLLLKGMPVCFFSRGLEVVRCSQFGNQVCLQFSLTLSLFVSRSGLQDVTDRVCIAGAKRWSVTISYGFGLVRLTLFLCPFLLDYSVSSIIYTIRVCKKLLDG